MKLSTRDVEARTGVSRGSVSNMETSRHPNIDPDNFAKVYGLLFGDAEKITDEHSQKIERLITSIMERGEKMIDFLQAVIDQMTSTGSK